MALGVFYDPGPRPAAAPGELEVARYAGGDDYHDVLTDRLRAFESGLEALVGAPVRTRGYVDTGPVQERVFAAYAGLGWIGKNTCLIHPELGSYLFLGVVLTELELEPEPLPEPGILTGELVLIRTGEAIADLALSGTRGGTLQVDGSRFRVTGVRPGRVRLVARAPRVEGLALPAVDLAAGAEVDLGRFELRRASEVWISVRDKDGRLVKGAEVRLELLPPDKGGLGRGPRKIAIEEVRTGRFEHTAIARFHWRLRVTHPRHAPHVQVVKIRKGRERLEVKLLDKR